MDASEQNELFWPAAPLCLNVVQIGLQHFFPLLQLFNTYSVSDLELRQPPKTEFTQKTDFRF